ncbi:uncharacterized protein LOC126834998 isoform X2 [Adelges cooleyi]|uniref:uncharacterized protein LOC126834998 isoform X2 n=1 Tax=Adelges cooleyi TaxID=133065 RepID=UPI0021800147|nr:uncharacterized protein LOC126834998 isoform X2 [Adelges cooleyi]
MSNFNIGDLVWAKMKGFPPWPGLISEPPDILKGKNGEGKKCVYFFGSADYAWIKNNLIKPYFKYEHEYKQNYKTADFIKAIEDVEKYIDKNMVTFYKKAKSPVAPNKEDIEPFSPWNNMPCTVLNLIFKKLTHNERKTASSTCKSWRKALYHSAFWTNFTILIVPKSDKCIIDNRIDYLNCHIIPLVRNLRLCFDTRSELCVKLVISVIKSLNNGLLKNLDIESIYCDTVLSEDDKTEDLVISFLSLELKIVKLISTTMSLEGFSYSGVLFNKWRELMLRLSQNSHRTMCRLELASAGVRVGNFGEYVLTLNESVVCDPFDSFISLSNLKILSIDYNQFTCQLFPAMSSMHKLRSLVLHVHEDPVTELSDEFWVDFKNNCPDVEVKLTIINCLEVIQHLHTKIFRPSIPLIQLKVLFCCMMNIQVIHYILQHYRNTMRSLTWVDGHGTTNPACLMEGPFEPVENIDEINIEIDEDMNPLLPLLAHCTQLSELTGILWIH